MARRRFFAWATVLILGFLYILGIAYFPKRCTWDSVLGILAAKQFLEGTSPSPIFTTLDYPPNIETSRTTPVTWWAPAYQIVPLWLVRNGIGWQNALKATILAAWILGMIGWFQLLKKICAAPISTPLILSAWLLSSWNASNIMNYNAGDLYAWSATPWLISGACHALRGASQQRLFFHFAMLFSAAAMCFLAYFLKYSAVLIGFGVLVATFSILIYHRRPWTQCVATVVGSAFGVAVIQGWRSAYRGTTPASVLFQDFDLAAGLRVFGCVPMAATDLHSILERVCIRLGHWNLSLSISGYIGLVVLAIATFSLRVISRDAPFSKVWLQSPYLTTCVSVMFVETFAIAGMVLCGADVSTDPRLLRVSGCILSALAIDLLVALLMAQKRSLWMLGAVGLFTFIVPAATWSVVVTSVQLKRLASESSLQDEDVRVGSRTTLPSRTITSDVVRAIGSRDTPLYVIPSDAQLWFPGQRLINSHVLAPFDKSQEVKVSPGSRVAILLGTEYRADAEKAKQLFSHVDSWTSVNIGEVSSPWTLWIGQ